MALIVVTPATLDDLARVYAERMTAALPPNWARRVSMHDSLGNVCWQSPGVWGPAEHAAVRLALERFAGNSAPARADHELPELRTAVLLRATDRAQVFRGFIMLVVDNRQLRGKGRSINDLPVPVQRAAHDWADRLAAAPTVFPADPSELSATQIDSLVAFGPTVDEPQAEELSARLRGIPIMLVAQALTPLQRGMRIRRHETFLRAASQPTDAAPVSLLREAQDRGLGAVLDRRVVGTLLVWLKARRAVFADEPVQLSVNLSASSIADPNFLRFVELCIAKAEIPPALLAFEVDQQVWRTDRTGLERLSQGLEIIGAGTIIDNVSLHDQTAQLLSLPGVRLVKIDRKLTRDLESSKVAQMNVAGIAQIARIAGVHTVAKQVEQASEQALLRALGVDFIQGFATDLPAPLESLDRLREQRLIIDDSARDPHSGTDSL
jgi:EAL domain-containing protein (putative c-di-GMP-specific phosphodiesterase class I)